MKLAQAIEFATSHEAFLQKVAEKNLQPDQARQILATVGTVTTTQAWITVICDYGPINVSPEDITVILIYDVRTGSYFIDRIY